MTQIDLPSRCQVIPVAVDAAHKTTVTQLRVEHKFLEYDTNSDNNNRLLFTRGAQHWHIRSAH